MQPLRTRANRYHRQGLTCRLTEKAIQLLQIKVIRSSSNSRRELGLSASENLRNLNEEGAWSFGKFAAAD